MSGISVADTSPLQYLILIDCVSLLPRLFERVYLPQAVEVELSHPRTPPAVRDWIRSPPDWIEVRHVDSPEPMKGLGAGELEAIALAKAMGPDVIILDDLPARKVAGSRGWVVIGTLGLLKRGSRAGLLNMDESLDRLSKTNFRIDPWIIRSLLDEGISDATLALQVVVGFAKSTAQQLQAGDLNGDGKIDIGDTVLILKRIVGL